VPWIDSGLRGKGQNLFLDARDQDVSTSSRQVPAADSIGKEDIPAKKLVRLGQIEAEAAGAVSRHMEKLRVRPRCGRRVEIVDRLSGTYGFQFFRKTKREHGVGVEAEKGGIGMIVDRASGPLRDGCGVPDMIPVAVGKKEGVGLEFFCFKEIEKALGGIDGKEMAVEVEKVCVGGGEATCISQRFFHRLFARGDEGLRD